MALSTFRETVALVAAKAKERLPQEVNGRVESAVKLVLAHDVTVLDDGSIEVGSSSDPLKVYRLEGHTCTCQDFTRGQAPGGWCQHRIAAGLAKRVRELLPPSTAVETEVLALPASEVPTDYRTPAPLPEAPASVNVHLTIGGPQVQVTLRGHDEIEVLTRLERLLERYPVPAQSPPSQADATPQCPTHGPMQRSKKGTGYYCAHRLDDDTWCKSKGR